MSGEFSKSDRRAIRELADLAWERELRRELRILSKTIQQMEDGLISPFEANDRIHSFHNGASRDLFKQYSQSRPWMGICEEYADGVLTDEDIAACSQSTQEEIREFARLFHRDSS